MLFALQMKLLGCRDAAPTLPHIHKHGDTHTETHTHSHTHTHTHSGGLFSHLQ